MYVSWRIPRKGSAAPVELVVFNAMAAAHDDAMPARAAGADADAAAPCQWPTPQQCWTSEAHLGDVDNKSAGSKSQMSRIHSNGLCESDVVGPS